MDVRSDLINILSGRLRYSGLGGYNWSSRINIDESSAYYLDFNSSDLDPSRNNNRYLSFPLRYLARQYIIYIQA